jgi:zinc transport system permease protein
VAVIGAMGVEFVRFRGHAQGDLALAILFYGGIAGGVALISKAQATSATRLDSYLFGAITTSTWSDLTVFACLAAFILFVTIGLKRVLFAVSNDEEYAIASGLPVMGANLLLAATTAVTVVVSMRVVGLLLISALMIVPVASAQLIARSFTATLFTAMAIGVVTSLGGVTVSYYADLPSGATIILLAILVFAATISSRALRRRMKSTAPQDQADAPSP